MFLVLLTLQVFTTAPLGDPFAFFRPTVMITTDDRGQLDRDQPIARVLPSRGLEVAVYAAVPVNVDGDRLVAWVQRIEALKKSAYVLAIRRFSNPPRIEDLTDLTLEDKELSEILACRPSRCGLKLSAPEMAELQHAAAHAGTGWKIRLQQQFRRTVLTRVDAYLAGRLVGPYEDHADQVWPADEFDKLVEHSEFFTAHEPEFSAHLRGAPTKPMPGVESFLYWSKERLANRPIVSVTDVEIVRSDEAGVPDALIAGKEVFSTHYINASFGLTALVRGAPGGSNYLVYVNRSEVDVLHGLFGRMFRGFVQRRVKAEAVSVLQGLRRRLESGDPPV